MGINSYVAAVFAQFPFFSKYADPEHVGSLDVRAVGENPFSNGVPDGYVNGRVCTGIKMHFLDKDGNELYSRRLYRWWDPRTWRTGCASLEQALHSDPCKEFVFQVVVIGASGWNVDTLTLYLAPKTSSVLAHYDQLDAKKRADYQNELENKIYLVEKRVEEINALANNAEDTPRLPS